MIFLRKVLKFSTKLVSALFIVNMYPLFRRLFTIELETLHT